MLLLALTVALTVLVSVPAASAAPAATSAATGSCWLDVINDWLDNNRVDRTYPVPCYTQAIQHLNAYPDVQNYSSATDDIQRALLAAIRQDRGNGPGAGSSSGPTSGGSNSSGGSNPSGGSTPTSDSGGGVISSFTPSNAQSVPLPLIVLGGLALLLLLSAGGTLLVRRIQARRPGGPTPAPAVDKRG